jgi:hypothetical protein
MTLLPGQHTQETEMSAARSSLLLIIFAAVLGTTSIADAAPSCQQLWAARNSIYKARGYCFKTDRAIRYFGNGGCRYKDEDAIPFTDGDRMRIAEITRSERMRGCGG